jgi:hypothetical protein
VPVSRRCVAQSAAGGLRLVDHVHSEFLLDTSGDVMQS